MTASKAMPFALATLAALAVQPLVLVVWLVGPSLFLGGSHPPLGDLGALGLVTSIVAAPFVMLIGIPAALLLRHHPHRGWWLALIGFLGAALPVGALSASNIASLGDLGPALIFGLHGLAGATAFHATWWLSERVMCRAERLSPRAGAAPHPRRSSRRYGTAPAPAMRHQDGR
jgi:hypothetical protein